MRPLGAMACASALFLVKPHYWPLIPFVFAWLVWRTPGDFLILTTIAVALPCWFFAFDMRHVKILSYLPVVGGGSYVALQGDALYSQSDYVGPGFVSALWLMGKRYAVWIMLGLITGGCYAKRCGGVGGGRVVLRHQRHLFRAWAAHDHLLGGSALILALFAWGTAWQFVTVGPYLKQAYAYVGPLAPLLAIVLGVGLVKAWR